MYLISTLRLLQFPKNLIIPVQYAIQAQGYAVPAGGKGLLKKGMKKTSTVAEKKIFPVEKDINKLLTYVCGTNILKEGGEDVKLKPDSEYPDWLWNIHTEKIKLEDLDPNTKQYWRKVRKMALRRNNRIHATRRF